MKTHNGNSDQMKTAQAIESKLLNELIHQDCNKRQGGILCPDQQNKVLKAHSVNSLSERELGILFLDLRNFTGFLQHGSQLENVQAVKSLLDLFSRIIVH
ncbi:MAG: hypothetical protein EOO88_53120, partial [Pedobacter sp.]